MHFIDVFQVTFLSEEFANPGQYRVCVNKFTGPPIVWRAR